MDFTNSKGITYFLHCRTSVIGRNKIEVKTYFFRKGEKVMSEICESLPIGWKIIETHSGLPVVKKL